MRLSVLILFSLKAFAQTDGGQPFTPRHPGEVSLDAETVIHEEKAKISVADGN